MENAKILEAILAASWQASIGLVILLGLRLAFGRVVAARWFYLLWLIVLIRLLVPGSILPETPASLPATPAFSLLPAPVESFEAPPASPIPIEVIPKVETTSVAPKKEPSPTAQVPIDWKRIAVFTWLAGSIGLLAYFAAASWWLGVEIRRGEAPTPEAIRKAWRDCCARFGRRQKKPRLITSIAVDSPVLLGLFNPCLVLPRHGLESLTEEDWEHIFLHELAHHERRDLWTSLVQIAALCVHWFNPLLWLCQKAIRADREMATDESVLGLLGREQNLRYGETLVRVLSQAGMHRSLPGAIGIVERGSGMKRRLRRILNFRPARFLATAFSLALLGGLALVTYGQEAAKPKTPAPETPPISGEETQKQILAAARAGNVNEIRSLTSKLAEAARTNWSLKDVKITAMLEDLAQEDNPVAFALLLRELRPYYLGMEWQPDVPFLVTLLWDNRKEFITVLLDQGLKLDLLTKANAMSSGEMREWTAQQVEQVRQKREEKDLLVKAASTGDLATMTRLLDAGADINGVASDYQTPLTMASRSSQAEAVRLLLSRGAEVDKPKGIGQGYTPLCLARTVEVAQLLKDAGADVHAKLGGDKSIVNYVLIWADAALVKWFMDQGIFPEKVTENKYEPTPLFHVRNPETARLLIAYGVKVDTTDERGRTALFSIAEDADNPAKVLAVLLEHGANPNVRDKYGYTPIMYAPDAASIDVLVAAGADYKAVNDQGQNALVSRLRQEKPDRRQALIRLGLKENSEDLVTMLKDTILDNNLEKAKDLLRRGANPDAGSISFQQYPDTSAMSLAVAFARFDIADEMRKAGGKDVGLLSQAAARGDIAKMRQLLGEGANVNEKTFFGLTPLYFAIRNRQMEATPLLLEKGADTDALDGWGMTPLISAEFMHLQTQSPRGRDFSPISRLTVDEAADFYVKVLPLLKAHRTEKEKRPTTEEILLAAAKVGNAIPAHFLFKEGVNVNYQDAEGMTALMMVIATKPKDARLDMVHARDLKTKELHITSIAAHFVEALLKNGADRTLRNREGKTALDLAKERNDTEITAILEKPAS